MNTRLEIPVKTGDDDLRPRQKMIASWPGPDPAIHVFHGRQTWITGSSPVMTTYGLTARGFPLSVSAGDVLSSPDAVPAERSVRSLRP